MARIDLFERWSSRFDKLTNRADWKARCRELTRLSPVADADAAAKLSAGFKDGDPRVRAAAGEALHKLGGARTISQLRCREIEAVAAGDHATALARLREELRDRQWPWPDVDARLAVVAALERIPGVDALDLLTFAAREPVSTSRFCRGAGRMQIEYDAREAEAVACDQTVSRVALESLARRGPQGIEVLFALAQATPATAIGMRAASAAARAGNKRGFTLLIEGLGRGSEGTAAEELVALAPASVDRLLAVLVGNRQQAWGVVSVLGRIADVRAVPAILKLTRDQKIGEACVAALQQILERNVAQLSTEQLNAIAQMATVRQLRSVEKFSDHDGRPYPAHLQEYSSETVTIDTQQLKALATAELHRRSSP